MTDTPRIVNGRTSGAAITILIVAGALVWGLSPTKAPIPREVVIPEALADDPTIIALTSASEMMKEIAKKMRSSEQEETPIEVQIEAADKPPAKPQGETQ